MSKNYNLPGFFTGIATLPDLKIEGDLTVSGNTNINGLTFTNVSANNILSTNATITNLKNTTISTGQIYTTGLDAAGAGNLTYTAPTHRLFGNISQLSGVSTLGNLVSPNINATNTTITNLINTNSSITNAIITNSTVINTILTNSSNGSFTNLTASNLIATNINTTNITSTNIVGFGLSINNMTTNNIIANGNTNRIGQVYTSIGNILLNNPTTLSNSVNTLGNILTNTTIASLIGRVAINTTQNNPGADITINPFSGQVNSILQMNTDTQRIFNINTNSILNSAFINAMNTAGSLYLGAGSSNSNMIISSNGFVGIGMTSPAHMLDVNGGVDVLSLTSPNSILTNITSSSIISTNALLTSLTSTNLRATNISTSQIYTTGLDSNSGANLTLTAPQFRFFGDISQLTGSSTLGNVVSPNINSTAITSSSIISTNVLLTNLTSSTLNTTNITQAGVLFNSLSGALNSPPTISSAGSGQIPTGSRIVLLKTTDSVGVNTNFAIGIGAGIQWYSVGQNVHRHAFYNGSSVENFTISANSCGSINSAVFSNTLNTFGNIFTTNGNIGISTTAPTQRLDVNGATIIRGNIFTTNDIIATAGSMTTINMSAINYFGSNSDITNISSSTLRTTNITTSGLVSTNINTTNLTSSNITTTNILNTNSTITTLSTSDATVNRIFFNNGSGNYLKLPILTTTQRDALSAVEGMMIVNSTAVAFQVYINSAWRNILTT